MYHSVASCEIDDESLAERFRQGDQQAFAELVRRHEARLFQVCLRITGDVEEAREALQECWVKAITGLGGFEGRSQVGTWLYTIATRAALDQHRLRVRRPEPVATAVLDVLLPPLRGPADNVVGHEHLRDVLAKLSPTKRGALVMRDVLGLSYREIAVLQGVPVTTVQARILRARRTVTVHLSSGVRAA